ncbi:MAG: hypothetical protein NC133_00160 [Prevotella sp.]|nr:hypothetical protein [Prevotella sp.]
MKQSQKSQQKTWLKIAAILSLILLVLVLFVGIFTRKTKIPTVPKGVWWWNRDLPAEQYLNFAQSQGINEIYYCDSTFSTTTANFIQTAERHGCKVYWLAGEYQWLTDESGLIQNLQRYQNYQTNHSSAQFAGVYLDIEPHQDPNFEDERTELLTILVNLAKKLKKDYPSITFDFDIPFWLEDELVIDGVSQPAYAHLIDNADRTFIMSYRDTASTIYDTAKEEIAFATAKNKTIFLGVETFSEEGDNVSFQEEGKEYMNSELSKLRSMIPSNFGIAIHQIQTWYDLKN